MPLVLTPPPLLLPPPSLPVPSEEMGYVRFYLAPKIEDEESVQQND